VVRRIQSLVLAILAVLPHLLGGAIPDAIGYFQDQSWTQLILTVLGIVAPLVIALYLVFRPPEPLVTLKHPRVVRDRGDTRKGLIILVSPLDPQAGNTNNLPTRKNDNAGKIEQMIHTAITTSNAALIDFEHSNLIQPLRAMRAHAQNSGNLRYVWLVSTKKSTTSAHALALRMEHEYAHLEVLHAQTAGYDWLEIAAEDSSEIDALDRTIRIARQTFQDTTRRGLKPKDVVCDVTGGFKSMTVGMTLASLNSARDLQYVPQQSTEPVITDFEIRTNNAS
jgi:hypothetical protein